MERHLLFLSDPNTVFFDLKYRDIPVDKAHLDGNLVTAPAWTAHPEWLAKFLKVLGTRIEP
jgi:protease I